MLAGYLSPALGVVTALPLGAQSIAIRLILCALIGNPKLKKHFVASLPVKLCQSIYTLNQSSISL
jgi:hypothetical protein